MAASVTDGVAEAASPSDSGTVGAATAGTVFTTIDTIMDAAKTLFLFTILSYLLLILIISRNLPNLSLYSGSK